jgi:S-adenosylmethionine synthetase
LPLSISLAHKLIKKLEEVRKTKVLDYLLPDAKSQVTVEFENDKPIRVDTIVVSNQHKASVSLEELKK